MDSQKEFCRILRDKGLKSYSINRWESGLNSPTLLKVDELCLENKIEPYFYDGNLFALLEFAREKSSEQGHQMNYQLNKL